MNKISNIISLPIISIYESENVGIVYNITFDHKKKKCKFFCVFNEEDNLMYLLDINNILTIGKSCVFIKNKSVLILKENADMEYNECLNPINFKCYNLEGNEIGYVSDIEINNKYLINNIILNDGQAVSSEKIANIGNLFLISDKKIKISNFRPQKITIKDYIINDKVELQGANSTINITSNKIITDYRFLVGRQINKDIIALNGELIAKANSIITKDVVNKASHYGKLIEIARYSVKKSVR